MPEVATLENGLRVVVIPMPHARSVALSLYVQAGSRFEASPEAGLSHFVEHLCFKGTARRPRPQDISAEIDAVGGSINAATEREYTVYYAKVTPEHTHQTLDILGDMLRHSLYIPAEVERERDVILEELAAVEDAPDEQAGIALDGLLWPGQPHGRDIAGSPETVSTISQERLTRYWRDQYVANGCVLAIAGAITEADGLALARSLFADWQSGTPGTWERNQLSIGERVRLLGKETEQAHLTMGFLGVGAQDPGRYALGTLSVIVGEGMSSRLFTLLREELALCYDVRSSLTQLLDTGAFTVSAGVDPSKAAESLREIASELRRARQPVTTAELERAKGLLSSRIQLHMEDTQAVAGWYGARAARDLPILTPEQTIERYQAVTIDDVQAVAQTVLTDEGMRIAVVGPFTSADELLSGVAIND